MIFSLALGASLFNSGCYRPSIAEGGLFCGPGLTCPSGFVCIAEHCYRATPDGARPDIRTDGGNDRLPGDSALDDMEGGGLVKDHALGESCDAHDVGTNNRTDNCATGLVCVDGNSFRQCFKRRSGPADCGGATCETRPIEMGSAVTTTVCALPPTTCDPTMPQLQGQCPYSGICYLITTTETTCEITSGDGNRTACTYSRECLPGYTCATVGPGARYCYPTCLTASPRCPSGSVCQPATTPYSYCY